MEIKILKSPNERYYIAMWGDKTGEGSSKTVAVNRLKRQLNESDRAKLAEINERFHARLYR